MSVISVSSKRWERAQKWELALWSSADARASGDDWNGWWAERFDHYSFLPLKIGRLIELGCGPFTNTRLILPGREVQQAVCSDPLARRYAALSDCWLARASAAGAITLDEHPAEELPFADGAFDVAVMINVLDHVRDAEACLRQAARILRPGGWFVLGQELSNAEDLRNFPYDIGHPIRLERDDLLSQLTPFKVEYERLLARAEGRNPEGHYATLLFAGRKQA